MGANYDLHFLSTGVKYAHFYESVRFNNTLDLNSSKKIVFQF